VIDGPPPPAGLPPVVVNRGALDAFGLSKGTIALYVFRECPQQNAMPKFSGPSEREYRRPNDRTYVVPGKSVPGEKFQKVDFPCLDQPSAAVVVRYNLPS